MARREDVRGIEADAKPLGLAHIRDNVGELLEGVAETRPLPGRRFQGDACFHLRNARKNLVDRRDHFLQTGFLPDAQMGAGMEDDKRQRQLVGPRQFLG